VWNVVDYSCVSFPSGVIADKTKDTAITTYTPLSEACKDIHSACELNEN
jgi:amidase